MLITFIVEFPITNKRAKNYVVNDYANANKYVYAISYQQPFPVYQPQ